MEIRSTNIKQPKEYEIDFSKVKTIEDVIEVLKALNVSFYDNHINFEKFQPYLKEVE